MKKVYHAQSFKLLFIFLATGIFTQSIYARTVNSKVEKNVFTAAPTITSFSPTIGPVGRSIKGTDSNNAALAGLTISSGTLSPAFATGTNAYTASVSNAITLITVKPTTSDPAATVTVNGTTVASGSASAAILLNVGANIITTIVTAQDGITTDSYTIVVTRALPALPNISYAGPQTYTAGIAITALSPANTGGVVPVAAYGKTSTFFQGNGGTLNGPLGMAVDAQGNVYSSADNKVYKISPAGAISVLAGSGALGNTNAQGALASFRLNEGGLAVDGQGNVYVADQDNNLIREISPSGMVSTLAGNGVAAIKDGPDMMASFNQPLAVAVDINGNVYVADGQDDVSGNYGIRKISPSGTVSTIAYPTSQFGGVWGSGGGSVNPLNSVALTVDAAGNIYVTGGNGGVIDKITPAGVVSTFAGNFGVQSELDGSPDKATFSNPMGIAVDATGNLYVSNNAAVRKVTAQGVVSTLAGSFSNSGTSAGATDGIGAAASFSLTPRGIAVDAQGNVYLADNGNLSIRKISAVGYALNTTLPQGLVFDTTKGTISGTPGAASPAANYSISAYNLGGAGSAALNILVGTSANLAKLVLSAGTLSPVFATNTIGYTASVANAVTSLKVTPTASDATATITINGTTVVSAAASPAIPLSVGANTITTVITGSDGVTTKTYTITVTRAGSADALLTSVKLTPSSTLSVVTGPSYVNYATTVAATTSSITVTAIEQDPTATLKINGVTTASGAASAPIALTVGSNVITIVSTAQDGVTTKTYTITATKAANASLSALKLSSGTLSPVFSTATVTYTASVTNATTSITVIPTASDASGIITVNGAAVTSGSASAAIPLNVGVNNITTIVTDGGTTKTYTVTVTRAPSTDALLTSVKLTPASSLAVVTGPSYVNYTTTVAAVTNSVTVTATEQDPTATLKVNGVTTASGVVSAPINLVDGSNVINITSTAQDGITTKTYTITATKPASANLSALKLSSGVLAPVFAAATTSYTANVTNATSTITVTPTAGDGAATIKVNGITAVSGTASSAIPLTVGKNTITTVVTDETATQTYTITVTRAVSTDALLTGVKLTPTSTLTVVTGPSYVNYTTSVPNATSSVTVTATEQDLTATIKVNGTATASGTASAPIALAVGSNTISIVSTAQDGVTTKTYTITATRAASGINIPDETLSVTKPANMLSIENDGVTVHQAVSPNGDGINDYLTIDNITSYPDNNLMIIDRNGVMVYQAKGYDNSTKQFDGHSNINGKMQLPGTYFYTLDYTDNGETKRKTGFIILKY